MEKGKVEMKRVRLEVQKEKTKNKGHTKKANGNN